MAANKVTHAITAPVSLLDNALARAYTHVHPVLMTGLLYTRFTNVIANPVDELLLLAPAVAALQSIYMMICLPPSKGSGHDPSLKERERHPAKRRANASSKVASPSLTSRIVPTILALLLTTLMGTPVFTALMILHGAPIASDYAHTALAALHLALLAVAPLAYVHGTSSAAWLDLLSTAAPADEIVGGAVGTCVGAWLGAVPIPLDWDREWQRWPVTVLAGAYGGWVVGRVLGGVLFTGRRIRLSD